MDFPWTTNAVSGTSEREQVETFMPSLVTSDLRFLKVVIPTSAVVAPVSSYYKSQAELEACLASNPVRAELQFQ